MSQGPPFTVWLYDRADVCGVKFTSSRVEGKRKAKDSVVMIRTESPLCKGAEFGRALRFIRFKATGTAVDEGHMNVAVVAWFKQPAPPLDWNAEIKCPCVLKQYRSDPDGNYWDLHNIVPTKIIMAPHLRNENVWQVLHVDSDFLTRPYSNIS